MLTRLFHKKIMNFCGNEPAWSIEAAGQSRLTLFSNIIYATDRQYLAVPSENFNMFKPACKPLPPGSDLAGRALDWRQWPIYVTNWG